MAAKKPSGSAPDTKVVKDVIESKDSSALEAKFTDNMVETESKEASGSIDDSDLKELEEAKKVPYDRFREVNEKAKSYQKQLEETKSRYETDLRKEVEMAELRLAAKFKPKEEEIYLTSETSSDRQVASLMQKISSLESKIENLDSRASESSLSSQIEKLEKTYPEADAMAVLGWKKAQPNANIEDLMALSHQRGIEKVEKAIRGLIEKKKEKSKSAVPTQSGLISLKEGEKPKSLREAHKMVKALGDKFFS